MARQNLVQVYISVTTLEAELARKLENVLQAAHEHGARTAGYSLLRLPYELKALFGDWLATHYPLKAAHVMNRLREMCGGSDSGLGSYLRYNDQFSGLLAQRFRIACERLGFNLDDAPLDTAGFRPPLRAGQMALF